MRAGLPHTGVLLSLCGGIAAFLPKLPCPQAFAMQGTGV